jgi:AcrR family transcriptional regulator
VDPLIAPAGAVASGAVASGAVASGAVAAGTVPAGTVPAGTVPCGVPHTERADAARNRQHLLATAREMLAEQGPDELTMDALAERACLGKGTVFRRFGTRAGIFAALLDDHEQAFQQEVLAGPPPLGPGAPPLDRLIAYGRARTRFLAEHRDIARAALDRHRPVLAGQQTPLTRMHIRMLLGQMALDRADSSSAQPGSAEPGSAEPGSADLDRADLDRADLDRADLDRADLDRADLDMLAIQLTAALDAPLLLYISESDLAGATPQAAERIMSSWQYLVQRVCGR